MITPGWVQMMARYNAWQNDWIYAACDTLSDTERQEAGGLFFGSIHGTLSHILWGDHMWLARFTGGDIPVVHQRESGRYAKDWETLKRQRIETDRALSDWAAEVSQDFIASDYSWFSRSADAQVSRPMAQIVTHLFNHQTHHRGQVHGALTGLGVATKDTDLFFLGPA